MYIWYGFAILAFSHEHKHPLYFCPAYATADWYVPDAEQFLNNSPDWFLLFLDKLTDEDRDFLLLILWENWSDRNALTHGDASFSVEKSAFSLRALYNTMNQLHLKEPDAKGKAVLGKLSSAKNLKAGIIAMASTPLARWETSVQGWLKINVDGSFVEQSGAG